MKVYLVVEQHKAEGLDILAVYSSYPDPATIAAVPSRYDEDERREWRIKKEVWEYEVIDLDRPKD